MTTVLAATTELVRAATARESTVETFMMISGASGVMNGFFFNERLTGVDHLLSPWIIIIGVSLSPRQMREITRDIFVEAIAMTAIWPLARTIGLLLELLRLLKALVPNLEQCIFVSSLVSSLEQCIFVSSFSVCIIVISLRFSVSSREGGYCERRYYSSTT
jgi:hypothetical protein